MIIVVSSKDNYNLLLGHEWIHVIGAIPFVVHQFLVLQGEEGNIAHLEEDKFILNGVNVWIMNIDKFLGSIKHCNMSYFDMLQSVKRYRNFD